MTAPVVPIPVLPPASDPAAPPPPPPPPPPLPPAVKKLQIRKSDFEKRIDAFNAVTDRSWLTHQNVDRLLHDAFVASGIAEDQVNEMTRAGSIDICAIDNQSDKIDYILLEAILKFIGQDPQKPNASIALCSGGQRDPVTGHISGGAHWTALHLHRVTDPTNGLTTIRAFTMDSGGNRDAAPAAVGRVLRSISDNRGDIEDAESNAAFVRAVQVLQAGDTKLEDAVPLQCDAQKDGYSCGYHAVFNLVRMKSLDDRMALGDRIEQDSQNVGAEQFIDDSKAKLMQIFPAPLQRVVPKTTSDPSRVAPAQDPENEVTSIVFDDKLGYVTKLEKLIAIEERLAASGDVLALSNLQIEKYYGKIINEIIQSLRGQSAAITLTDAAGKLEFDDAVSGIITNLEDPKISQNPKIILESLKQFFGKSAPEGKDFLELFNSIDLQPSEESEEQKWQDRCAKLCDFLKQSEKKLPESFKAMQQHTSKDNPIEESLQELYQVLQSTISLEQRKQKIFKDLDLVDLDNAKNKEKYRALKIEGTYYLLERDDEGVISLWQNPIDDARDNFSKVDQAKIDHVLHKIESEITSKKISRMQNEGDEFVEGADGSVIFVVKTLIDPKKIEQESSRSSEQYSPSQIVKEKAARISEENAKAKCDGERWEMIGEKDKKIEMAKFVTLPKDDAMWKLDGKKIKLVGELGTEKHTKLDSEIMKYYLDDHVGKNVEETKKRYGVTNTINKPNPIISKLISAKALKMVSQIEVSA